MEEQKDLGSYSEGGTADAVSQSSTGLHTPGPWIAQGETIYALDETETVNRFYINIQRGYVVKHKNKSNSVHTSWTELNATARLIAAAPELLDALTSILYEDSDKSEADRLLDRVKAAAAIDKAMGVPA